MSNLFRSGPTVWEGGVSKMRQGHQARSGGCRRCRNEASSIGIVGLSLRKTKVHLPDKGEGLQELRPTPSLPPPPPNDPALEIVAMCLKRTFQMTPTLCSRIHGCLLRKSKILAVPPVNIQTVVEDPSDTKTLSATHSVVISS